MIDRSKLETNIAKEFDFNIIPDKNRGQGWFKFNKKSLHVWQCVHFGKIVWQTAFLKNDHFIKHKQYDNLCDALKRNI